MFMFSDFQLQGYVRNVEVYGDGGCQLSVAVIVSNGLQEEEQILPVFLGVHTAGYPFPDHILEEGNLVHVRGKVKANSNDQRSGPGLYAEQLARVPFRKG